MKLRLLITIGAAACLAATASPASAAEYVVRPAQTHSVSQWSITPSAAPVHEVLADPVTTPAAPDTASGFLSAAGSAASTQVGFAPPALPAGATVTGFKVYTYVAGGTARAVSVSAHSGFALLGTDYVPAGAPGAWRQVTPWLKPTVAQLSDVRMTMSLDGNGPSTPAKVFAAYAVVTTSEPASTGGDDPATPGGVVDPLTSLPVDPGAPSGTPGTQGTPGTPSTGSTTLLPPGAAAVSLPVKAITAISAAVLHVPVTCQLSAGCSGTITARPVGGATSSRRRKAAKAKRAKSRFRLKAGQSKTVPVRLDRRTARLMRKKRRAKIAVTIAVDGAAPVTKQVTVLQRRNSGRRR